ncbi:WecB/TagA/CpsF family glycosyltransferase [Blastopirellula sp. JC732]|uniref:WecB/TagA/CpsF family glycosyltransferase n=1 Tax=Blastopirellula sediminis TaxID=2894196 RepID=A0A9X1MHP4_9BACT|nr:WecB/TagA/CpsF family glycosyltransferase [Blastopirellula sediminis]MCC9608048.1 WecB/TagA/CpsF family glycosyltransferase [Blastopirellula sediminis]MCC9627159.1 WecB/TagA/CpsF family glycosyltransferase [Blastopirellula sediminis]
MIDSGKHSVLGIQVDAVDYEAAVQRVITAAHEKKSYIVSALAVHGVMTGALDAEHRKRLNQFDLLTPDGQPVRWALNLLHRAKLSDRVYGPNMMLRICERAAAENLSVLFFGGTPEMLDLLEERLTERMPGLRVAGKIPSQFRQLNEEEAEELAVQIEKTGADITFVGIGCPRQEIWAYEYRERLSCPIIAVGAAFPFHAGQLSQAPPTLQKYGLEWAYRLVCEPRRLWRRYLYLNPLYVGMLLCQATGIRKYDREDAGPPPEKLRFG